MFKTVCDCSQLLPENTNKAAAPGKKITQKKQFTGLNYKQNACYCLHVVTYILYTYSLHVHVNTLHTVVCIQLFAYNLNIGVHADVCIHFTYNCIHFCKAYALLLGSEPI